jgi:hypothetical protein
MAYHTFHGVELESFEFSTHTDQECDSNDGRDSCIYRSGNSWEDLTIFGNGMQTVRFAMLMISRKQFWIATLGLRISSEYWKPRRNHD